MNWICPRCRRWNTVFDFPRQRFLIVGNDYMDFLWKFKAGQHLLEWANKPVCSCCKRSLQMEDDACSMTYIMTTVLEKVGPSKLAPKEWASVFSQMMEAW